MPPYKTSATKFFIKKESLFNGGAFFSKNDYTLIDPESNITPKLSVYHRNLINNSFVDDPPIFDGEDISGTLKLDLSPKEQGSKLLEGDALFEACIGASLNNALITDSSIELSGGTARAYKLNRLCTYQQTSLAIALTYNKCNAEDSRVLVVTGVLPSKMTLDIPVADICKASFSVNASSVNIGVTTMAGNCEFETIPDLIVNPYVGKNVLFTVGGVLKPAKDVTLTLTNTIANKKTIIDTDGSIGRKFITAKKITGTFTALFTDWNEVQKMKNQQDEKLFIKLQTNDIYDGEYTLAIYLPRIRYTEVTTSTDNGLIVSKIQFEAYKDPSSGEAIIIAQDYTN